MGLIDKIKDVFGRAKNAVMGFVEEGGTLEGIKETFQDYLSHEEEKQLPQLYEGLEDLERTFEKVNDLPESKTIPDYHYAPTKSVLRRQYYTKVRIRARNLHTLEIRTLYITLTHNSLLSRSALMGKSIYVLNRLPGSAWEIISLEVVETLQREL